MYELTEKKKINYFGVYMQVYCSPYHLWFLLEEGVGLEVEEELLGLQRHKYAVG